MAQVGFGMPPLLQTLRIAPFVIPYSADHSEHRPINIYAPMLSRSTSTCPILWERNKRIDPLITLNSSAANPVFLCDVAIENFSARVDYSTTRCIAH
jgi:hypothetical protein